MQPATDLEWQHEDLVRQLNRAILSPTPDWRHVQRLCRKLEHCNDLLMHEANSVELRDGLEREKDNLMNLEEQCMDEQTRMDITGEWLEEVRQRSRERFNTNVGTYGGTGGGKSYFDIMLAYLLDPTFDASRVCFDLEAFARHVEATKPKQWLMWDEIGVGFDARGAMEKERRPIYHVLETYRVLERNLVYNTPDAAFADRNVRRLTNYMLVMRQRGAAQLFIERYEPGVPAIPEPVGMVYMKMPPKHIIEPYEKRKAEFVHLVLTLAQASKVDEAAIFEDALAKLVRKHKVGLPPAQPDVEYFCLKEQFEPLKKPYRELLKADLRRALLHKAREAIMKARFPHKKPGAEPGFGDLIGVPPSALRRAERKREADAETESELKAFSESLARLKKLGAPVEELKHRLAELG